MSRKDQSFARGSAASSIQLKIIQNEDFQLKAVGNLY